MAGLQMQILLPQSSASTTTTKKQNSKATKQEMKLQNYSAEGAHDQAMEASANLLQLYSRETNSITNSNSTGYSSDGETSPMQGVEESSVSSKTSHCSSFSSALSSTGSEGSNSSQESDDIESEIQFLREKQNLLKRAIAAMKREDAYEASRARQTIEGKLEREVSPLWSEAKEILDLLDLQDGDSTLADNFRSERESVSEDCDDRPSKKTKIDVSTVTRVTSASALDVLMPSVLTPSCSTVCEFGGPWVGQTLARTLSTTGDTSTESSSAKSSASDWQVVNDSYLGVLVVPPPLLSLNGGIELRDALSLSTEARYVFSAMSEQDNSAKTSLLLTPVSFMHKDLSPWLFHHFVWFMPTRRFVNCLALVVRTLLANLSSHCSMPINIL